MERTGTEKLSKFACSCGDDQKKLMADLHEWVKATYFKKGVEPQFYVTALLHRLHWNYWAEIERIALDQWGGMKIQADATDHLDGEATELWIEFDRFEDGLALALKNLYAVYGEHRLPVEVPDVPEGSE